MALKNSTVLKSVADWNIADVPSVQVLTEWGISKIHRQVMVNYFIMWNEIYQKNQKVKIDGMNMFKKDFQHKNIGRKRP